MKRILVVVLFAFSIGCSFLQAQTTTGSIRGVVTDPSEAVISGAAVVATNTATGVMTTAT